MPAREAVLTTSPPGPPTPGSMLCFSENSFAPCNTPSRFTWLLYRDDDSSICTDLHDGVKRKNRGDSSVVDENIDLSTKEGLRPGENYSMLGMYIHDEMLVTIIIIVFIIIMIISVNLLQSFSQSALLETSASSKQHRSTPNSWESFTLMTSLW